MAPKNFSNQNLQTKLFKMNKFRTRRNFNEVFNKILLIKEKIMKYLKEGTLLYFKNRGVSSYFNSDVIKLNTNTKYEIKPSIVFLRHKEITKSLCKK